MKSLYAGQYESRLNEARND